MKKKIYTKTGDHGFTSLLGGKTVLKSDSRVDLYGEVDELNSLLGIILAHKISDQNTFSQLINIQKDLFEIGGYLACQEIDRTKYLLFGVDNSSIKNLEKNIDTIENDLPEIHSFLLPGGSKVSAHLYYARAITRRVERKIILFKASNPNQISDELIVYTNRLSDYFFVLARYLNKLDGVSEEKWIKKNSPDQSDN